MPTAGSSVTATGAYARPTDGVPAGAGACALRAATRRRRGSTSRRCSGGVELLEQQQREVADKRVEVDEKLAKAEAGRAALEQKLVEEGDKTEDLLRRIEELEAAAPKPTPRKPLAGRAVAGGALQGHAGRCADAGQQHGQGSRSWFWTDFQCPFCKRVQPTLDQIEKEYGKDVRFAMKHNPLPMHARAMAAAKAAEAAGKQGKYWKMHDVLWNHQKDLTDENFVSWARDLKLDIKRFKADLKDAKLETKIKDDMAEASTLGARGVPAFFINGIYLSGAQPFPKFKEVIDKQIEHARQPPRRRHPCQRHL